MGRNVLSEVSYRSVAAKAEAAGSATFVGEQRRSRGLGLDPLIDPSGFGVIRRALSWYEPRKDGTFELLRGVALPEETLLDTTGSMGNNVEIAMRVLPTAYKLLSTGNNPVAGRYDMQMATSIFGDRLDTYILQRSQFEMDERIADAMTKMYPERGGEDAPEDPQYGLFGAAYLTEASIYKYGLKSYHFTVSDAPGRHSIDDRALRRVFGDQVYERLSENGHAFSSQQLPNLATVLGALKKRAHAFFLQVGREPDATQFWTPLYGHDRIVVLPRTELLPYVKAAIIGLTEGTIDLQSIHGYMRSVGLSPDVAHSIARAVSHIPLEEQKKLPNFDKIPLKGAVFANKGDLFPVGTSASTEQSAEASTQKPSDSMWL